MPAALAYWSSALHVVPVAEPLIWPMDKTQLYTNGKSARIKSSDVCSASQAAFAPNSPPDE